MNGLRVVYGERLDGGAVSPANAKGSLGAIAVGPAGLLSLVETFTGLSGPPVQAARRIALMRRRLAAYSGDAPFWAASFEVDPWAVAREVLRLRDSLVEAGWNATAIAGGSRRLADLAALEAMTEWPVLPGRADRISAAIEALGQGFELPVHQILVVDPPDAIGPGVGRLLKALEGVGVQILYQSAEQAAGQPGTDLARAQAWLLGGEPQPLQGDGTLVILKGRSEAAQAEAVADWLAASPEDPNTVIILGSPSGLLDGAMARRGLPRFAHLQASQLRGAVQVLALAIRTRWRPFSPEAMLDLLSMPLSPIPGDVVRELATALAEAPGRGGPRWIDAIEKGQARRRERFEKLGLPGAELASRIRRDTARWRPWLEGEQYEESPGMPALVAREICGRVAAWAARVGVGGQGVVIAAGQFATTLSLVIAEAGLDVIPRVQLERMIDSVVADGIDAEYLTAEASPWAHAHHPAQVLERVAAVMWWGFSAEHTLQRATDWADEELSALAAAGIRPEGPDLGLYREAAAARGAVVRAAERVVLVAPAGPESDQTTHPLLHELTPVLKQENSGAIFHAEELLATGVTTLAGRQISRTLVERRQLPDPRRTWSIAPTKIQLRPVESANSIELLLGCPFAWSLQYAGKLRPSRRSEIPHGEKLLGLLAHALAAEVFQPGASPSPDQAFDKARERLPTLIDEMAAPLRLPGAAADYVRALSRLPVAMRSLAETLGTLGAIIVGAEVERDLPDVLANGVSLSGRIDLLIKDQVGQPAIIDMKWSRTDRYRRDEIRKGHSVQLAVYGRLLGSNSEPAPAAYFMLSQARVLPAGDNLFGPSGSDGAPELAHVWANASTSWQARMTDLTRGHLVALSAKLLSEGETLPAGEVALQPEAPCRFCDKTMLCGHARAL